MMLFPPNTASDTITFRHQLCGYRLIRFGTQHNWAPHIPDLNPLDSWFLVDCKGSVYSSRPATLDDMKQKVSNYLQAVPVGVWKKVGQNFGAQINECPNRGGAHNHRERDAPRFRENPYFQIFGYGESKNRHILMKIGDEKCPEIGIVEMFSSCSNPI